MRSSWARAVKGQTWVRERTESPGYRAEIIVNSEL